MMLAGRNHRSSTKRILLLALFVLLVLSLIVVAYANSEKDDSGIVCIDLADFFYEIILALAIFPPQASCSEAEEADVAAFIEYKVNEELDALPGTIKTRNKICSNPINSRRLTQDGEMLSDISNQTTAMTRVSNSFLRPLEKQEQENTEARHLLSYAGRPFIYVGGGRCRYCFYDNKDQRVLARAKGNAPFYKHTKDENNRRDLMFVNFPQLHTSLPEVADISLCDTNLEPSTTIYSASFRAHRRGTGPSKDKGAGHGRAVLENDLHGLLNLHHSNLSHHLSKHPKFRGKFTQDHFNKLLKHYAENANQGGQDTQRASAIENNDLLKKLIKNKRIDMERAELKVTGAEINVNEQHVTWTNDKYTTYTDKVDGETYDLLGLYKAGDRFMVQIGVEDANNNLNGMVDEVFKLPSTTKLPVKKGEIQFSLMAFDLPTTKFSTGLLADNPIFIFINGIKLDFNLLLSQPGIVIEKDSNGLLYAEGGSIAGITWSISTKRHENFGYGSRTDKLYEFIINAPLIVFAHKNQLDVDFIIKPDAKAKHYALREYKVSATGAWCTVTGLKNSRFQDFKSAVESRIHNRLGLDLAHKYQNKPGHCLYDRIPVVNAHLVEKEKWQGTKPQCNAQ